MEQLPSMWRTEVIHPLFVHFPIALLLIGSLVLIVKRANLFPVYTSQLHFTTLLMLTIGTLDAWAAVITGEMAYKIVGRTLCDPTVVHTHETFAKLTAFLFTTITIIEFANSKYKKGYFIKKTFLRKVLGILSVVLALSGIATISYVGHLGGKLVYQQGAAVHQPSEDCAEFE